MTTPIDKEIIKTNTIISDPKTPREVRQVYADHLAGLLSLVRRTLGDEPLVALTKEDLLNKGWWCADISQYSAQAFYAMGLEVYNLGEWTTEKTEWDHCRYALTHVNRTRSTDKKGHEIVRKGSKFYWRK